MCRKLFILKLESLLPLPFRVVALLHLIQLFVTVVIFNTFELSVVFELCSVGEVM